MMKLLPVARVGEIPVGKTKTFRFGVQNGVVYNDNGVLKAYVNACTHMGGPTELVATGVFRCRWHGAEFDPKTGERLAGQAPEGSRMKPITLVIEGDHIFAQFELIDEFA